jgi:hypothetical protein
MIGSREARVEFGQAVSTLVAALREARTVATDPSDEARVRGLIARVRRELNLVDEKLLMLDRRRQRSMFLHSERLRRQLDDLELRLACYYVERTFDTEDSACETDPKPTRS